MPSSEIVNKAEQHVTRLLNEKLTPDHLYHNLPHTLSVRSAALAIGQEMQLNKEQLEILELAALFHDTGFTNTYEGHELESRNIAIGFLNWQDYPEASKEKVLSCIDATLPAHQPNSVLEEVIRDADLVNLASDNYPIGLSALRHEWRVFLNKSFSDTEWFEMNTKFLKSHTYHTQAAEALYGEKKKENQKYLKKTAKKERKLDEKQVKSSLQGSKSVQMMFKTALRNHIDLSTLADNKANIMLSVNALIITVAMPMAVSYILEQPKLIYPVMSLLLTCLLSMIFATLATRPIKMTGETTLEKVKSQESNLFFFGNFYKMKYPEYKKGMSEVISDEEMLEDTIQRDLFFLGKSLGNKYYQLRVCYNIFMVGIIISVILFIVIYRLNYLAG